MQKWKKRFVPAQTAAGKQLRCALVAGVFSLLMFCGCLVGPTFAWFNHSVDNGYVLQLGYFSASGYMTCDEDTIPLTANGCELPAGEYTLTICTEGDSIGYCVLRLTARESDTACAVYYTERLSSEETKELTIHLNESTEVSMWSVWGELAEGVPTLESELTYGIIQQGEKAKAESISNEDAPNEDTSNEETSGEETSNEDTYGEETPNGDTSGEETSNEETSGEETSNEDTSGEDTSNEDTSNEDTPAENVPADNTPAENTPAGSVSNGSVSTENTPMESAPAENTSTGNTPVEGASE